MFHIIPNNFFVPLSSPNRIVYWECISRLFAIMEHQLSFGVEREVLVDELEFYFGQENAAQLVEEEFQADDSRSRANGILRRLEYYGWIEVETDVQRVNFKEYAVKIIKTLLDIADGKQIEYQGYIYTIYSLVKGTMDKPGIVLMQIWENTDYLITGLKNLNSNIKHYIDDLTRHSTVAQIMDALFNDYITNIVDKAYHRLLTSDNVSKFRPEIMQCLEKRSHNEEFLEKASAEIAAIREVSEEEGRELTYRYLHEIIEAFRNMDEILQEINQKNTQYQRAAINRAKFLLAGNEDVRGQLKEILMGINEEINRENMDLGGIYRIDFLDDLVRIYQCSILEQSSLYLAVEGKKEFIPSSLENEEPDEELRREKMRKMAEKIRKVISVEKIQNYVNRYLAEKDELEASQLPLNNEEDFIKLIYVRLYGQRKNMGYVIETLEEREVNGYRFRILSLGNKTIGKVRAEKIKKEPKGEDKKCQDIQNSQT
jgi:hypothetical protein